MLSKYIPINSLPNFLESPVQVLKQENPGTSASPWLDDYIQFSREWSPLSYEDFHEAVGLFILSTVAARRVAFNFGKRRYTNLYIALVGRTSIFAKTTVADIGVAVLQKAGLDWLLAPDNSTPQWLIKYMSSSQLPDDYNKMPEEWQQRALCKALTAGQKGWCFDEFGMHIHSMMQREGVMTDFRTVLRRFDDVPDRYENATIARGHEVIERPYLSLLANLTPADLAPFARRGAALWGDGYLARFGLVTPPEGILNNGRFPHKERVVPDSLFRPLRQWHDRLGMPEYDLHTVAEKPVLTIRKLPMSIIEVSSDVYDAHYRYMEDLRELISQSDDTDLDGNYSRFPEKALRISALFASLGNCKKMELSHWNSAQAITERWRGGLHELYNQVCTAGTEHKPSDEDKVYRVIVRKKSVTKREIVQYTKLEYDPVIKALGQLMQKSMITIRQNGKTDVYELL